MELLNRHPADLSSQAAFGNSLQEAVRGVDPARRRNIKLLRLHVSKPVMDAYYLRLVRRQGTSKWEDGSDPGALQLAKANLIPYLKQEAPTSYAGAVLVPDEDAGMEILVYGPTEDPVCPTCDKTITTGPSTWKDGAYHHSACTDGS